MPPANAEIWLFIGESYARGAATDTGNIPAGYPGESQYHVTAEQEFSPLFEPCAFHPGGGNGLSPGGAFVWLRAANGRPQILVNMGRGGTTTAQWRPTDAPSPGVGWLEQAIDYANWAIAESGGTLKGIVWMQGVNDAIAGITTYRANTELIEAKCRAGITGAANVPFLLTQLQPTTVPQATQVNWDAVRDEQALYTGPNRHRVTIRTGTMTGDGLHPQSLLNLVTAEDIRNELAPVVP